MTGFSHTFDNYLRVMDPSEKAIMDAVFLTEADLKDFVRQLKGISFESQYSMLKVWIEKMNEFATAMGPTVIPDENVFFYRFLFQVMNEVSSGVTGGRRTVFRVQMENVLSIIQSGLYPVEVSCKLDH